MHNVRNIMFREGDEALEMIVDDLLEEGVEVLYIYEDRTPTPRSTAAAQREAARIQAKEGLRNLLVATHDALSEETLQDKFEAGDKETIETAVQQAVFWLIQNETAGRTEFEAKKTELEGIVNPIMTMVLGRPP